MSRRSPQARHWLSSSGLIFSTVPEHNKAKEIGKLAQHYQGRGHQPPVSHRSKAVCCCSS